MCTIMTFTKEMYTDQLSDHLIKDMLSNPDGFSVLLVDNNGEVIADMHTMDNYAVLGLLEWSTYARAFVHCRMSTQGAINIRNTHGFFVNGIYYQHNGILSDPAAKRFAVDSMLIGAKIVEGSLHSALTWLKTQAYANCFFIDTTTKQYFVTRNSVGTLYTDGKGNYSTTEFSQINQPVMSYSEHVYALNNPIFAGNSIVPLKKFDYSDLDTSLIDEDEDEHDNGYYLDDRTDRYDFNSVNSILDDEDDKYMNWEREWHNSRKAK